MEIISLSLTEGGVLGFLRFVEKLKALYYGIFPKKIYSDSRVTFLQIYIDVEVASEITVIARLNPSNDLTITSGNSDGFSYSYKVQHLPPIVLTCLLPKSYPSHVPPCFTIAVQWLAPIKISSLCSMLDSIWQEQPGQEVVYRWVEWLQSSSLPYLGFDEKIDLGPYGVRGTGDKRAISGSVSPDVDIPSIRSYNDDKCHKNFLKNLHECCICFSEYAGNYKALSWHYALSSLVKLLELKLNSFFRVK